MVDEGRRETEDPCRPAEGTRPGTGHRIGYVLKMYPRFSETFILSELLHREAAGARIEIFSLRPPVDPRFHDALARVRAPVTWLSTPSRRPTATWELLRTASGRLPGWPEALTDLLTAGHDDAMQAVELALAVRHRGLTHLHAHFASVAATVARLAAHLAGVTYSFTAHAKDIFHADVDADDLHRKLGDAHHAVTVSDYNVTHLRDRFGAAADGVHRVYNGIDLDAFAFAEPTCRPPTIVAVGRLVEKKGFGDLLDACAHLAAGDRRFRCDIVGGGVLEGELRSQASALGLDDIVIFAGPLPQPEVRRRIQRAAVLAAPCLVGDDGNRDGLPTVLLEAMALGTPSVSTPVTGIPEVVRHGETGLLVPERDARALADALARCIDDVELRVRLAKGARQLVEEEFDGHRQAAALDALLPPLADAQAVRRNAAG